MLDAAGLAAAPAVAVRRSALVVDDAGPSRARVESARVTPEQVRLLVQVDGPRRRRRRRAALGSRVAPGDEVALRVDVTRLAVLPITSGP